MARPAAASNGGTPARSPATRSAAALGLVALRAAAVVAADPPPLVLAVRDAVQPEIDRHLPDAQKATLAELALADTVPAKYKPALRQRAVRVPWAALAELEKRGLDLAAAAGGGLKGLPDAVARANDFLDRPGDDTYTDPGYALGIGGPCGVGEAGDERYRCGFAIPSGYNTSDAPAAKPGDPNFQYDAFGLGIGLGRRTYPFSDERDTVNLAGGVGVWLDLAGDDRSESSNFSQACVLLRRRARARPRLLAGFTPGGASDEGLGVFFDGGGDDEYPKLAGPAAPANGAVRRDGAGGLFVDR